MTMYSNSPTGNYFERHRRSGSRDLWDISKFEFSMITHLTMNLVCYGFGLVRGVPVRTCRCRWRGLIDSFIYQTIFNVELKVDYQPCILIQASLSLSNQHTLSSLSLFNSSVREDNSSSKSHLSFESKRETL
jgi:hypothetical protein